MKQHPSPTGALAFVIALVLIVFVHKIHENSLDTLASVQIIQHAIGQAEPVCEANNGSQ